MLRRYLPNAPPPSARAVSSRTLRCPDEVSRAHRALLASGPAACAASRRGGDARARPSRQRAVATQPPMTRPSTRSSRNGPPMRRCGRHASPVWTVVQPRSTSRPACSMATEPTPWPPRRRWRGIGGRHASDRGAGDRDHRPSARCRRTRPCSSRPCDRRAPVAAGSQRLEAGGHDGRGRLERRLPQPRRRL
jgi:hypothetical protein